MKPAEYVFAQLRGDGIKAFPVVSPSDAVLPHVVYSQVARSAEEAIEGEFSIAHVFRLDIRAGSYDVAEDTREKAVRALRKGGRLEREGNVLDIVEGTLDAYVRVADGVTTVDRGTRTQGVSAVSETGIYRRIQDVDIAEY